MRARGIFVNFDGSLLLTSDVYRVSSNWTVADYPHLLIVLNMKSS